MDLIEAARRGVGTEAARHPWEPARIQVIKELVRRHALLRDGAVVVDVGCGDGFVVEQLASVYREALFYAVDTGFTEDVLVQLRGRFGSRRILPLTSLGEVPRLPDGPASLILLMDVIEHVPQDIEFLKSLSDQPFVGSSTTFLITAPAYEALSCSHDLFLGHYRRYSNVSLTRTVERAGLRVVDSGYFFLSLLAVRALQRLRERVFGIEPEEASSAIVTWRGDHRQSSILARLLELDARVSLALKSVRVRLPGLSNYMICVKG